MLTTLAISITAAVAEITGCVAFWAWLRLGKSTFWRAPGLLLLLAFAWLLTLSPAEHAGRAYAVYGGVSMIASLGWLGTVEGFRPDRWD